MTATTNAIFPVEAMMGGDFGDDDDGDDDAALRVSSVQALKEEKDCKCGEMDGPCLPRDLSRITISALLAELLSPRGRVGKCRHCLT
jgi:hypothetical protein